MHRQGSIQVQQTKLDVPDSPSYGHASVERLCRAERGQTALYVAHLASELAEMAAQSQLDTLAYLLNLAQLEAETEARRT